MIITCQDVAGRVPVTVMAVEGALDGSNFQQLIARAQDAYNSGSRHILLDLSGVPFMSSAGLVAMHSIASLLSGRGLPDLQNGWAAFHEVERDQRMGRQAHVKLLKPQEKVDRVLKTTGMDEFFEIHEDLPVAVASF